MKYLGVVALGLVLLCACGDQASQACSDICGKSGCLDQLGVDLQGADCFQACEAQIDAGGEACVNAIAGTLNCLGTCDFQSLTNEQILKCEDVALSVSPACDQVAP